MKMDLMPDQPIQIKEQDELNRLGFINNICKIIQDNRKSESIVIGLEGPWGSGKTSVLNLISNELNNKTNKKPIIFKFNPWGFSEGFNIYSAFFSEFIKAISDFKMQEIKDKKSKFKEKLISFLKKYMMAIIKNLDILFAFIPDERIRKGLTAVWDKNWEKKEKSIQKIKTEINKLIKKANYKIIIIIDDMGRLYKSELMQIFQILKYHADFENTTYIIAYDGEKLNNIIDTTEEISDKKYLEKIIQVQIKLPKIEKIRLYIIIFKEINELMKKYLENRIDEYWDEFSFYNLFHKYGVKEFFKDIRSIKRFLNNLNITLSLLVQNYIAEVEIIDLIGIETLKTFEPEIYDFIKDNKLLFTTDPQDETKRKKYKEKIEEKVPLDQEYIWKLLNFLFENLKYINNLPLINDKSGIHPRTKGIGSEHYFEKYFILGIPFNEVSENEFAQNKEFCKEPDKLKEILIEYIKNEKIHHYLKLIFFKIKELNIEEIKVFLKLLFELSDKIYREESQNRYSYVSLSMVIEYLILSLEKSERIPFIKAEMEESSSVIEFIDLIGTLEKEIEASGKRISKFLIAIQDLNELKKIITHKVYKLCQENKFFNNYNNSETIHIFNFWNKWDLNLFNQFKEKIKENIHEYIQTISKLHWIPKDSFGREIEHSKRNEYNEIKNLFDIKEIKEKFEAIDQDKLESYERKFVKEFLSDFNEISN